MVRLNDTCGLAVKQEEHGNQKEQESPVCCCTTATPTPDNDQVNHPSHYQSCVGDLNIEAIDCMRAAFGDEAVSAFCLCNALKYIYRCKSKGGNESIEKAIWYLNKYLELNK